MAAKGRPRKFKVQEFREAVEKYFRSITTLVPIMGIDGENALDMDGNEIVKVTYVIPPSISSLCLKLGIDRRTWANYADPCKNGGSEKKPSAYSMICDDVKLRIEAYLNEQLLIREKSVQGVIFNLSNNFGWSEKRENSQVVEFGEKTRETLKQNLTMDEKFALIREAAMELGEADDHGEEADEDETG